MGIGIRLGGCLGTLGGVREGGRGMCLWKVMVSKTWGRRASALRTRFSIKFKGCPEVPTLLASEIPVVPYSWFVVDEDGSTDGTKGVCVL